MEKKGQNTWVFLLYCGFFHNAKLRTLTDLHEATGFSLNTSRQISSTNMSHMSHALPNGFVFVGSLAKGVFGVSSIVVI